MRISFESRSQGFIVRRNGELSILINLHVLERPQLLRSWCSLTKLLSELTGERTEIVCWVVRSLTYCVNYTVVRLETQVVIFNKYGGE